MMTQNARLFLLLSCAAALLIAACMPPTPIAVYMTATFIPDGVTVTPSPALPTSTAAQVATDVVLAPTNTPAPPTDSPAPNVTWRGSVVGEGYVAPATNIPPSTTPSVPETTADVLVTDTTEQTPTVTPTSTPGGAVVTIPTLDPNQIGIQLDINLSQDDWNDAMSRIETLGIKWVKVQLSWREMQPNNRDERDNEFFRRVEQYLEDANRRGLNVLVSVAKAPNWARANQTEDGPPDNAADLANFITILLDVVNPDQMRDQLGEYIDAIEIWNEPNLIREWQGALPFTGAGYMTLFAPSYQAIRAYSQTMPIITAGLAPTGTSAGSVDDREFLRQMYAAGLGNYPDVLIGIHPYSWGNAPDAVCCGSRGWDDDPHFFFADTVREYREIMNANGHTTVAMWMTEFGYASWDGLPGDPPQGSEWMRFNDRWAQAGYTIRTLQIAQTNTLIGPVMLWNLNFAVLAGMIDNRDERAAYSMIVPGEGCQLQPGSTMRTERPLFWMLYDAVRPDVQLPDFCGVPPSPIPGLS
jgi:hypothetical protein